jgi:signal transduction histidine kinase
VRLLLGNLAVAVGYWTFAELGSLAQYTGQIEVAWLPVGFAAGMLYLGDLRWFVGGMVGDFVVGANFGFAFPWDVPDLVTTAGNTIEFVLAAYLMRRWLGPRNVLERPTDVGRLFVAIGIGTAVSAVVGNLDAVWLGGAPWSDFAEGVRTWWLGDTSGGLLLAPLLMVWWANSRLPRWHFRQVVEGVGILGLVAGVSVAVFSSRHPLTYVVFPALVLAAVYLGQRGATLAVFLTYAVAVGMTAADVGPFASRSIDDQTLDTQLYVLVASVTTLILGAAVSARRRAAVDLAQSRERERERGVRERERIARDLHDSVSQTLFSLGLQAGIAKHEIARTHLASGSALPAAIDELALLAHGALVEIRASIFELRGDAITEQGLVAALGAHGAALAVRNEVSVSVEGPPERLPLSPAVEELLFRIGQEAVTNAVKHSGSVSVSAKVTIEDDAVALDICDQGVGFDAHRSYGGHLGLELMRIRASEAGGRVMIDSSPTTGTAIRVVVPSATARAAAPPSVLPGPRAAPPASVS